MSASIKNFLNMNKNREAVIDNSTLIDFKNQPKSKVRELKDGLHPIVQFLKIDKIIDECKDVKSFILVPDNKKTLKLAYFEAGKYLSITCLVNGQRITRPYSIASSPKDSLNGFYMITVKRKADGILSNYLLNNAKVGDVIESSAPLGEFTYNVLRDKKELVFIAGGSGVTPFRSLIKAVVEKTYDLNITLLYGAKTEDEIIYKDYFDSLNDKRIKVVYVLSDSKNNKYENGFINKDIINKYKPERECSYFISGPYNMFKFLKGEIETLNLRKKLVRYEIILEELKVDRVEYNLVILKDGAKVDAKCYSDRPLIWAIEKAKVNLNNHCRSGECGFCHSKLVSGDVYVSENNDGRRLADLKYGYIHPCSAYPKSDIVIELPSDLI